MKNLPLRLLLSFQLVAWPILPQAAQATRSNHVDERLARADTFNKEVQSLRRYLFEGKNPKELPHYTSPALDAFGLLGQTLEKTPANPGDVFTSGAPELQNLNPRNILVEVVDQGKATLAVLNGKGDLVANILDEAAKRRYKGSSHIARKRASFRLGLRQHLLHSFPQSVKWVAVVDTFVVFLDPAQVLKDKAFLSFIDLDYFKSAIGKTALPIFKIPVTFGADATRELITKPHELKADAEALQLALADESLNISREQLAFFSKLQQLLFNSAVSFVDISHFDTTKTYVQEMGQIYIEHLEKNSASALDSLDKRVKGPYRELKTFIQKMMLLRGQLGSFKEPTGPFGVLKSTEEKLQAEKSLEERERQILEEFSAHLGEDLAFQQAIAASAENLAASHKFLNRTMLLFSHITRPQPLGAPKIKKALGLIANSVRAGETAEQRVARFKEASAQFFFTKRGRIGTALLAGMGMVASADVANHFINALGPISAWMGQWGDLASYTWNAGTSWLDLSAVRDSYFAPGKASPFLIGIGAMFSILGAWFSSFLVGANSFDFAQQLSKNSEQAGVAKVLDVLKNFFSRKNIIAYMEQNRRDFLRDLSLAEMRKIGLVLNLTLPDGTRTRGLFRTTERWKNLFEAFSGEEVISLEIEAAAQNPRDVPHRLELISITDQDDQAGERLTIELAPNAEESYTRSFRLTNGTFSAIYAEDGTISDHNGKRAIKTEFSTEKSSITGLLEDSNFSAEDEESLKKAMADIQGTQKKATTLAREIQTFRQAINHLFTGYSSWKKAYYYQGQLWNWLFLSRNSLFFPYSMGLPLLYHAEFFNRIFSRQHRPTRFNGGLDSRLRDAKALASKIPVFKGFREKLAHLRTLEDKVIFIEKNYLKVSTELAFFEMIKDAAKGDSTHKALRHGAKEAHLHLKGRDRLRFERYQRELFRLGMKGYFADQVGLPEKASEHKIRRHLLAAMKEHGGNLDWMKVEDEADIRSRLREVSARHKLPQKTAKVVNSALGRLTKLHRMRTQMRQERKLNPKRSLFMDRFKTSGKMLKDPESMARATRQELVAMVVDKPIELSFTLLFLAAIDQGILQVLHEEIFSENSWFHLSRYAIWYGFFMGIVFGSLTGVWAKLQADSRLDAKGGFEIIPKKADVAKKVGYLKWYWKQFKSKDNTMWENYKFSAKIAYTNFAAALISIGAMHLAMMGRFDLDIYTTGYMATFLLPFGALALKMENAFEKSANFSLKELIKRGIDLSDKHRKLMAHPLVQEYKMRESAKLRRSYNIALELFYGNPLGNMFDIFVNSDLKGVGSRAFMRLLMGGNLATEYVVDFMNFLERNGMPSGVTGACKRLLTRNRTDLAVE